MPSCSAVTTMRGAEARLAERLGEALGTPVLRERLHVVAEPFLNRRGADDAASRLDGASLRGVARVVATSAEGARLLAARPELLERLAAAGEAGAEALAKRAAELEAGSPDDAAPDLEDLLDVLRLVRREETLFAACLDLGGVEFAEVSRFLSVLAEHVVRRALARAHQATAPAPAGDAGAPSFAVVGMGKIGGREFTYHSDLDLLFLHAGGPEEIVRVSRVGQRLVSYLTTTSRASSPTPGTRSRARASGCCARPSRRGPAWRTCAPGSSTSAAARPTAGSRSRRAPAG
jgi:hypothetical protein